MKKKYGLKCLECNDEIYSEHRHDFVRCKCGACFVDGGNDYFRAGAKDFKRTERIYKEVE